MVTGVQKAKQYGIEENMVRLEVSNVGAGDFFLTSRGAIYQLLEWLPPPSENERSFNGLQWASGEAGEVLAQAEPDDTICVERVVTFTPPEIVWFIGDEEALASLVGEPEEEEEEEPEQESVEPSEEGEEMLEEATEDIVAGKVERFDIGALDEGTEPGADVGEPRIKEWEGTKREWVEHMIEAAGLGVVTIPLAELVQEGVNTWGLWPNEGKAEGTIGGYLREYKKEHGGSYKDGELTVTNPVPDDASEEPEEEASAEGEEAEVIHPITKEKAAAVLGVGVGIQITIGPISPAKTELLARITKAVQEIIAEEE